MSHGGNKWLSLLLAVSFSIVGLTSPELVVAAPSTNSMEQQQINQRDRQQAEERKARNQERDVFLQNKESQEQKASLPVEKPSFLIQRIILSGNENYPQFYWLPDILKDYQGKKIGREGINLLVKKLTNSLIDHGYVTSRVLIPRQDLSTGTLDLVLVPGKIHAIRIVDATRKTSWKTAFPVREGDLLNLRDLEQGLEQLKRVPSQDAQMQLVPAEQNGESDVIIQIKQGKAEKVILSLDDSGNRETGKIQSSATFAIDNLLGINDLFHAEINEDVGRRHKPYGTDGGSWYYSFPYGNWTYSFSENRYHYYQQVPTLNQPTVYSGRSDVFSFNAKRLMDRDQTSKTYLEFGLSTERKTNYVDDTEIEVQREKATALEVALSQRKYCGEAVWDWRLSHKQGIPWFNAQEENDLNAGSLPTTRFNIWNIDIAVSCPVKIGHTPARYSATFRGQYTKSLLYSNEQFSIGNRYTVRGFDGEQTLLAESGWYLQNELSFPLKNSGQEIYVGLDCGRVRGPSTENLLGTQLVGAVLGVRGGSNLFHYDLFVGWPVDKPEGYRTENMTWGFQLTQEL